MDPHRVPMARPSSAVKPMVVATLRPARMAHRLAPFPRWHTTVRPEAARPSTSGSCVAMNS